MAKNDYRRSLIMLRAHENGYSGHVRLEHRIMMGSMYFTVSARNAPPALCALLVRQDARGGYAAAKLGELRWDGRGQSTLAHSFDPRNIAGKPLDDYFLIVIAAVSEKGCAIVLTGNVNGSRSFRFDGMRDAVCAACDQNAGAVLEENPSVSGQCASCAAELETPADDLPETGENARTAEPDETADAGIQLDLNAPRTDSEIQFEEAAPQEDSGIQFEEAAPQTEVQIEEVAPRTDSGIQTDADSALQIAASAPWSGAAENVRALFLNGASAVLMLGDGYTYVRAPMPEDSGFPFVNVGVKLENGAPVGIAYAFPASFSAEPPEGLEDYAWRGGAADGWWVLYTDPETGEGLAGGE